MRTFIILLPFAVLGVLLQGCSTAQQARGNEKMISQAVQVDITDPLLNHRQILLIGPIDQPAAERTIQKVLFLDGKSHEAIDLYLQTPGGELKSALAIVQTMLLLHSAVNTYARVECNSTGAMLLAAGAGNRRAAHGAVVVIHGLEASGKPAANETKWAPDTYADFWRQRTKLPDSWFPLQPLVLHVLSAEEALKYGIVDEVIGK